MPITAPPSPGDRHQTPWVAFSRSLVFLVTSPRLLGWSLILIILTGSLTWVGYLYTVDLINQLTGNFFVNQPAVEHFWHWPVLWGWTLLKWIYLILTRVIAFYLAFIFSYSLTTPGYVFLSSWTGDRYCDQAKTGEAAFSLSGVLVDLIEGIKIGGLGLVVTVVALVLNFMPVLGQASVFLLYVFYSTLMFIDFPSSRYRWSLGQKLAWLRQHTWPSFRLGLFPALISMVPLLNVFLMAFFFPLFTVHATLNFLEIEGRRASVSTL